MSEGTWCGGTGLRCRGRNEAEGGWQKREGEGRKAGIEGRLVKE